MRWARRPQGSGDAQHRWIGRRGWSPEQIAGRLTRGHSRTCISHESIYRFIYHRSAQKDYWHHLLPRAKHRRGRFVRQGGSMVDIIKQRRSLQERPQSAGNRQEPGHWEADFMLFARHGQAILVAHERTSRFTAVVRPEDRKARATAQALADLIAPLPPSLRRTITFDNGSEFAHHHQLAAQANINTFFCDVRSPWQKGGVENAIGRLRRSMPRKADIATLTEEEIQAIANRYNTTPRKCLDFRTPEEAFYEIQTSVALQT